MVYYMNYFNFYIMKNDKFYSEYTSIEILDGYNSMLKELQILPDNHELLKVFLIAWNDFIENKWKYDGATFVNEKFKTTTFEVAAFIHDWRNSMGYVGYYIDNEMFNIMILLNYKLSDIKKRYLLTRLTFVNKIIHIIKNTYKNTKPNNIITL